MKAFVTLLLILSLPARAWAGGGMPFCNGVDPTGAPQQAAAIQPGTEQAVTANFETSTAVAEAGEHEGCEGSNPRGHLVQCDQCSLCHLACASALPVHVLDIDHLSRSVYRESTPVTHASFVPEPSFRPPALRSA